MLGKVYPDSKPSCETFRRELITIHLLSSVSICIKGGPPFFRGVNTLFICYLSDFLSSVDDDLKPSEVIRVTQLDIYNEVEVGSVKVNEVYSFVSCRTIMGHRSRVEKTTMFEKTQLIVDVGHL